MGVEHALVGPVGILAPFTGVVEEVMAGAPAGQGHFEPLGDQRPITE